MFSIIIFNINNNLKYFFIIKWSYLVSFNFLQLNNEWYHLNNVNK